MQVIVLAWADSIDLHRITTVQTRNTLIIQILAFTWLYIEYHIYITLIKIRVNKSQ